MKHLSLGIVEYCIHYMYDYVRGGDGMMAYRTAAFGLTCYDLTRKYSKALQPPINITMIIAT